MSDQMEAAILQQSKTVLHVGCGAYARSKLHTEFLDGSWQEVRLDINPDVGPDIVATIADMRPVLDESHDAIYSAHNLEHLYPHEVPLALREFRRVLRPDGFALIVLPDLQAVAQLVSDGQLIEPAYLSPMGPVAPLDILYGFRPLLAQGNVFMAHHTGFIGRSLSAALLEAGFAATLVQRHPDSLSLWALGFRELQTQEQFLSAQQRFLPLKL
jgi:SAM-dependent methyltransferase